MTDRDRICAWLRAHGPTTSGQIARALGLSPGTVTGALAAMERDSRVEKCGASPVMVNNGAIHEANLWRVITQREVASDVSVPIVQRALRARPVLERVWMGMQG